MKKTYVIIGTSAAGLGVLFTLQRLEPLAEIICISDECENPYNKCFLADYVAGVKQEAQIYTARQLQRNAVTLLLGTRVEYINRHEQCIRLFNGQLIRYDVLFIGTGSSPICPPIPGINSQGVFTFHTLRDVHLIMRYMRERPVKRVVIIGAGLTGLECADALRKYNVHISIIEMNKHILNSFVHSNGAHFIEQYARACGIALYTSESVQEIISDQHGKLSHIRLASGVLLQADIVVCATGVRANVLLAREAELAIYNGGMVVNEYMNTCDKHIYAGGDAVMIHDIVRNQLVHSCTWPDAMQQGVVAAHAMAGQPRVYSGAIVIAQSSFFGLNFVSCGPITNYPASYDVIVNKNDTLYHCFLLDQQLLKGFLLISPKPYTIGVLKRALQTGEIVDRSWALNIVV